MITITKPTRKNWKKICTIDKEIFKEGHEGDSVLVNRLRTFPEGCFVALDKGREVGYLSAEIWSKKHKIASNINASENHDEKGTILYISGLGVLPHYQNKKIGSQLLEKAIHLAQKRKLKRIILRTHAIRSKRFYEKFGFQQISYKDIEQGDACYIMELQL